MAMHLPLALLTAGQLFVADARTTSRGDSFVVEIQGEGGALDPTAVRTKLSSGALYLELVGTRARSGNRAWGEGAGTIHAHRHASYTEIEIPLVGARGCAGPVSVAAGEGGSIVATVKCGAVTSTPHAVRAEVVEEDESDIPRPSKRGLSPHPPARGVPVLAAAAKADVAIVDEEQQQLRAAVARPTVTKAEAPKPEPAKTEPAKAEPVKAELAKPAAPAKVEAKPAEPAAPAPKAVEEAKPAPAAAVTSASSGGFAVAPVVALLGLGGAGVLLARRRKRPARLVHILETTSLGPKRSLIVAKLGDQTLVLGASEAGIAVLQTAGAAPELASTAAASGALPVAEQVDLGSMSAGPSLDTGEIWPKAKSEESAAVAADNAAAALASIGDPANDTDPEADADMAADTSGQARFLAKLFGGRKRKELSEEWPFDEVLEDSFEDQELRAKLAAGMGAKIP